MVSQVKLQKAYVAALNEADLPTLKKIIRRCAKHWDQLEDKGYLKLRSNGDAEEIVEYVASFDPWEDDEDGNLGQLSFYRSIADAGLIERPEIDPEDETEEEEEEEDDTPKVKRKAKRQDDDEDERPRKKKPTEGGRGHKYDLTPAQIKEIRAALKKTKSVGGANEITGVPHRIIREVVSEEERAALGVRVRHVEK